MNDPWNTLPGPYRVSPDDDNSYRVNWRYDDHVEITDCFGGHTCVISREEYESWPELPPGESTLDPFGLAAEDNWNAEKPDFGIQPHIVRKWRRRFGKWRITVERMDGRA